MSSYEEAKARCEHCPKLEKCAEALGDYTWTTNIPIPEDIGCEYFPKLGVACNEYVQVKIYEELIKHIKEN